MTDRQLVVHLFAPTDGPSASEAYQAIRDVWLGARYQFGMTEEIPELDLPHALPESPISLRGAAEHTEETVLAAQENRGGGCQAVLRRHHSVLNLSLALTTPRPGRTVPAAGNAWNDLDRAWDIVLAGRGDVMLGEARIYLAHLEGDAQPVRATSTLGSELGALLPAASVHRGWEQTGCTLELDDPAGTLAVWEPTVRDDGRARRRLLVALDEADDPEVSAWLWSDGSPVIPPLARYLLSAAKIRYHLRVWRRSRRASELCGEIEQRAAELQALTAAGQRRPDDVDGLLYGLVTDAGVLQADLARMRRSVEIAVSNMAVALSGGPADGAGGLFADDRGLARSLLDRLDDAADYLGNSVGAADWLVERAGEPDTAGKPVGSVRRDISRNVFVVHGRDHQVRDAMFGFLKHLGLEPLEWETIVDDTGVASPFLGDVVAHAVTMARAAVVLLTPDDIVALHPGLHGPHEQPEETIGALQPRPNVLIELGMALAAYPSRTVIVQVGTCRRIGDIAGRNYIALSDSPLCRSKIASRLRLAGCPVPEEIEASAPPGSFAAMSAYARRHDDS